MTTTLALVTTLPAIPRADLLQEDLVSFPVDLASLQIWNSATGGRLVAAGTDDLGYVPGTWATASPMINSITSSGTTVAEYGRFRVKLPESYVSAGRVQIKCHCQVEVQANVSAELDIVVYESDKEGGIGADLNTTAAKNINAVAWADVTFEITATGLVAGDELDCRLHVALDDTAGANACIANIGKIELLCAIKG